MTGVKRDGDVLSDADRRLAVAEIVTYFEKERSEKIGVVAASQILDVVLRVTHKAVYNRALDDITSFLERNIVDIDISLRK